jgi:hypothetical protein
MKCTVETLLSIKETINTIRSEVNTLQKNKSAKIEALHNSNVELQNSNVELQNSNEILFNKVTKLEEQLTKENCKKEKYDRENETKNHEKCSRYYIENFNDHINNSDWSIDTKKILDNSLVMQCKNFEKIQKEDKIELDVSNDIAVYSCFPRDTTFIYMLDKLLSYNFKKIYFIYSSNFPSDYTDTFESTGIFDNPKVVVKKVENKGFQFMKYYSGLSAIIESNEEYNKVWLLNDSFIITKWKYFIYNYNNVKDNDVIIPFISNTSGIKHFKSYLCIINHTAVEYYLQKYRNYTFDNNIDARSKMRISYDLEISLSNELLCDKSETIKCKEMFALKNANFNIAELKYGPLCGIIKLANPYYNDYKYIIEFKHFSTAEKILLLLIYGENIFHEKFVSSNLLEVYYKDKIFKLDPICEIFKLTKNSFMRSQLAEKTTLSKIINSVKDIQKQNNNDEATILIDQDYTHKIDYEKMKMLDKDRDYIYLSNYRDVNRFQGFKHVYVNSSEFTKERCDEIFSCYKDCSYL